MKMFYASGRFDSGAQDQQFLPDKAIAVRRMWANKILCGGKIWEIRGTKCHHRGRVAIAISGTGLLFGEVRVVDCIQVGQWNESEGLRPVGSLKDIDYIGRDANKRFHQIDDLSIVRYKKVFAWVLSDAKEYLNPIPYEHRRGAVTWIVEVRDGLSLEYVAVSIELNQASRWC